MLVTQMNETRKKKYDRNSLVEILDNQGQVILHTSLAVSLKQKLRRKIALVAAKNVDDKFILRRQALTAKHNSGLWDISVYANVFVGESCEDAALRELYAQYGIEHVHLREILTMPYQTNDDIPLLAVVFSASALVLQEKKNLVYINDKELMFATEHELSELVLHSPELFTAELIWAVQAGWLK